jgi:hypothetical protein
MSASNAAARKRRAPQSEAPVQQNNIRPQPNVNQTGLTLPQVINIIDNRLIKLEAFVKESSTTMNESPQVDTSSPSVEVSQWIGEFNNRFEILAEEIGNLKDIVLKLQSYTMEVNKTLLDERIHVFSDLTTKNTVGENIVLETVEASTNQVTSLNLQSLVSQELSQ